MVDRRLHVVFDLDDTLYPEAEYAASALRFVGQLVTDLFGIPGVEVELAELNLHGNSNPIGTMWLSRALPNAALGGAIEAMRSHRPEIALSPATRRTLTALRMAKTQWSILTDGRSITQRQKIVALGLMDAAGVYISQERGVAKPESAAYIQVMSDFPEAEGFVYVADNPLKDFVAANKLGWRTIMLRDAGLNLHKQDPFLPELMQASCTIENIEQILHLLRVNQ